MTEDSNIDQPKHYFRPKSRIMVLLGEQLIKNHTLALFELVKNSYDADASKVDLTLLDIDQKDGMIEITDNGYGMSYKTVTDIWMEPAHGHKGEARITGKRTPKGRLAIGEKGVGRFAVHRLGAKISMVTRAIGEDEVVVNIDWDKFLENDYLDQSEVEIVTRKPSIFTKNKTGTQIVISNLRQKWRRGEIRKLFRSVSSMTSSPLTEEGETSKLIELINPQKPQSDFCVDFIMEPDKKWLDHMFDPKLAINQSLFRFDFILNDQGLSYNYSYTPYEAMKADYPGLIKERVISVENIKSIDFFKNRPKDEGSSEQSKKRTKVPVFVSKQKEDESTGTGELCGRIIGFDFDKEIETRYIRDGKNDLSNYIKNQGGLRVYRDGLRVYNYGELGDDWLHLDHRRIQSPTKKLSNRLMMGTLNLELKNSAGLIEKTNREGFVENNSYKELVHAMLTILTQFEAERNKDKRALKNILSLPAGSNSGDDFDRKPTTDELLVQLKKEVLKEAAYKPLEPIINEVTKAYKETRDVLMSAAGAGLGLVTVFHELERGVRNLHQAIEDGTNTPNLQIMSEEIVSLLRGAMYMVNTKEMETFPASKLVQYVLLTQQRRLKRHGITFLNGFEHSTSLDFDIKGIRRMLTTTLVNLLDNAIYWADDGEEVGKYIWIGPSQDLESPAIVIADSGPGFIDKADDVIQPFFSRKPSGMGIGLYYSDMVMKTHKGRLSLPEKGAIETPKAVEEGACIAMVFDSKGSK
jgi:signal transduction histidine kinase